ncbi:MAG: hypothetical protein BGO88_04780 [Flavobacterium sp. 38-13]|uniref:hypothetical protein n=1 Tax=Flavobacterium sp. 38-13 TaxID=1896168 RepID=UPI0009640F16|nr:hypothetical protein [Flavobacterium sp. 38-13]OJX55532.1 MAG: hypothetical protein BGO88_04780 [Flavobacterium sp. 38-13]
MPIEGKHKKIILLPEDIDFIEKNYHSMSNKEIADHFGLKLQRMRELLYQNGFKRMQLEYWSVEQIEYLKENYKTKGDVELATIFESKWPKEKKWTLKHIEKKRNYLHLSRTPEEIHLIKERNVLLGCYLHGKTWKTRGASEIGTIKFWSTKFSQNYFPVIKTEKGFVHYYRWLWIKNNGPLKPNEYVVPKKNSKSSRLLTLAELEVVNRTEHALRNAETRKMLPEELKKAISIFNKLSKELKNNGK